MRVGKKACNPMVMRLSDKTSDIVNSDFLPYLPD